MYKCFIIRFLFYFTKLCISFTIGRFYNQAEVYFFCKFTHLISDNIFTIFHFRSPNFCLRLRSLNFARGLNLCGLVPSKQFLWWWRPLNLYTTKRMKSNLWIDLNENTRTETLVSCLLYGGKINLSIWIIKPATPLLTNWKTSKDEKMFHIHEF